VTGATGATGAATINQLVLVDLTTTATITLPTAVGVTGQAVTIKNKTNGGSTLTVNTTSSQTIDGVSAPASFSGAKKCWKFTSDGSNWWLTGQY
jgi:hypothetical protein